ncbi:metallophosphoesterase [Candidatus Poseidoniaceae archaeon]|nr:metallophosphoesterase [Candidatus Poseidoniaceae archaeon]
MSVKILATGDFQLDKTFGTLGKHAEAFRKQLMATFKHVMLESTKDHDIVLIAGDLFDRMGTPIHVIQEVAETLAKCPITCVVLPGNHDPVISGIPKALTEALKAKNASHVHVALKREPIHFEALELTLYPAPLFRKDDISNQYAWIPVREEGDGLRVALMHGALTSLPNGLIPEDLATEMDLDLVICGDQHGPSSGDPEASPLFNLSTSKARRLYYAMAPEAQNINQNFTGSVLSLEVSDDHEITSALRTEIGALRFVNGSVNFAGENGIEEQLALFFEPYNGHQPGLLSLRLELTGNLNQEQFASLRSELDELQQQWPLLELDNLVLVANDEGGLAGPENPLQTMIQDALHASDASDELRAKVIELLPIIIGRCE